MPMQPSPISDTTRSCPSVRFSKWSSSLFRDDCGVPFRRRAPAPHPSGAPRRRGRQQLFRRADEHQTIREICSFTAEDAEDCGGFERIGRLTVEELLNSPRFLRVPRRSSAVQAVVCTPAVYFAAALTSWLPRPRRVALDVFGRRHDVIVSVCGVHAPADVIARGERKKRKLAVPPSRTESPGHAQQVARKRGTRGGAAGQDEGEAEPGHYGGTRDAGRAF